MGQKVRPTGFRVGIMTDWLSQWYAGSKHDFAELLVEDKKIRDYIKRRYGRSGIARIKIDRTREKVTIYIYSARVGMIIGKKGQEVDKLTADLQNLCHRVIEVKTMVSSKTLFTAIVEGDHSEYIDQCNGAMWLLGRQWVDLVMWAPDLADAGRKGLHIVRIERDDDTINALEADLLQFSMLVDDFEKRLRLRAA